MMATTWTDVAAAISASVLVTEPKTGRSAFLYIFTNEKSQLKVQQLFHPSVFCQSRFGPRTIAMLLGVILLTSLFWASFARNFTRYLQQIKLFYESLSIMGIRKEGNRTSGFLPEVGFVSFWHMVTCQPQGLEPLVRVRDTKTKHRLYRYTTTGVRPAACEYTLLQKCINCS